MSSDEIVASAVLNQEFQNPVSINPSYGASLTSDVTAFEGSIDQARQVQSVEPSNQVIESVIGPLEQLNAEATALAEFARSAAAGADGMTPSEIIRLTVKSQEFMFHSQLTANVANRTADGIQQLFRQQG